MQIHTKQFGVIEAADEEIIRFEGGLPGFEQLRRFVFIREDEGLPFSVLQSVDDGEISFVVADPFFFYPNYEFELTVSVKEELQIESEHDVGVWAIVTVKESLTACTLNLLAPVIVNTRLRLGRQMILNGTAYTTRHSLPFAEKGAEHARTDT